MEFLIYCHRSVMQLFMEISIAHPFPAKKGYVYKWSIGSFSQKNSNNRLGLFEFLGFIFLTKLHAIWKALFPIARE
jgi:hypothetical protein